MTAVTTQATASFKMNFFGGALVSFKRAVGDVHVGVGFVVHDRLEQERDTHPDTAHKDGDQHNSV